MGVVEYFAVEFVGDVGELVEDLLVYVFLFGEGLREEREVLANADFAGVQELLHDAHELHELLGDDVEAGCPSGPSEHLGAAVDELSYLLHGIEGQTEVELADEHIQNEVLVDAEYAEEVGFEGEGAFDFESAACVATSLR